MAKKRIKRNKRYFNTYDGGGLLGQFASWNEGATKNFMSSGVGSALGKLGVSSGGLGGLANGVTSTVSGLINPSGNSTGVGNAMQAIGSVASNIPGIGGVIGAGVNLVGGLVNAAFGSNLNEEFIAETEDKTRQQANYVSDANDNASLMSDWGAYTDMAHVKKSDVGSDGWFSNKAKNKTKELNKAIDRANFRAWSSLANTAGNIDTNNDMLAMSNFAAYGGPLFSTGAIGYELASRDLNNKQMKALGDMKLTSLPNSFNALPDVSTINTFAKGGGIHIKKKNRGKFTSYCGGKVTSECIARGKRSSSPAIRKRATFAANARKWKHEDGGPLNPYSAESLVDAIYSTSKGEQFLGKPSHNYDFTISEEEANRLGYYPDERGHRDDRVKKPAHPTHPSRGKWNSFEEFELTDKGMENPNYTLFGLNDGGQDPQATMTYKGGIVLPEITVTPKKSYIMNPYDNTKIFDKGGPLLTHGGIWDNGLTYINEGGSHEENPFEGVQMGVDPQGIPNLVEEGEVVYNDYVFSNRMKVPKDIKKKLKTKGDTFAEAAKELSKESEERPNDPISKNGLDAFMSALSESQEELRMKSENRKNNRYAKGGKLGKRFDGLEPDPNILMNIIGSTLPTVTDIDKSPITINGSTDYIEASPAYKSKLSYLRFAPAVMSGISAFTDLFSKPDYSAADRVASIDIQPALVSADPIGQYLSYRPLDRMFYINQLNKNAGATRRAVNNNSGGNRAAALAGILAADANYSENLGKLARQAEEYNQALKERVVGFNRQTDMFNSQQSMQAQTANQASRNSATQMRSAQAERVAQLRQAAKDAYNARRSNNLNSFITNLGNIGWEDYQREMINSNPALYYTLSGIGGVGYKGTSKKNGGKLKKKRRTTYA